jgi:hypothetical protein
MKRKLASSFTDLEKIVCTTLGLRPTRGSGNQHNDGDGKGIAEDGDTSKMLLAECKYTEKMKNTISFKKIDFKKTEKSSRIYGRTPVMCTADADGQIYILLTLEDFEKVYQWK